MNIRTMSLLLTAFGASSAAHAQDACNEACLTQIATQYMSDVADRDWSRLPWADRVRYTENNVAMMIGDGFWGAGPAASDGAFIIADETTGNVLWYGITSEHGQAAYHALRLKVEQGRISEVESLLGREGTPDLFAPTAGYRLDEAFAEPVANPSDRVTLTTIVERYFDSKQLNDGSLRTSIDNNCAQLVNGVNLTHGDHPKAQAAQGCKAQLEIALYKPVERIRARRYPIVDTERGIVVALSLEDHAARTLQYQTTDGRIHDIDVRYPNTRGRMDLFRIVDGSIERIEGVSVFLPYYIQALWDDGLSQRLRRRLIAPDR